MSVWVDDGHGVLSSSCFITGDGLICILIRMACNKIETAFSVCIVHVLCFCKCSYCAL